MGASSTDPANAAPVLTGRERAVLCAGRDGLTNGEIASLLGISVRTVRFHIENARAKLSATNRTTAIVTAVNLQLL